MREPLIEGKFLLQKRKDNKNTQALLDLEFETQDIIRELLGLQVEDYVYTTPDKVKSHENPYKVFHKEIKHKEIYIKIKIKETKRKILYCMSFHEAQHKEQYYPYK